MVDIVQVSIPGGNIFDSLNYLAPAEPLPPGLRVEVSLRNQKKVGIVTGVQHLTDVRYRLKPIISRLDELPIVSDSLLTLAQWLADYYHSPLSDALKTMLPKKIRLGEPLLLPQQEEYALLADFETIPISKQAIKQQKAIALFKQKSMPQTVAQCQSYGIEKATLKALKKKGVLSSVCHSILPPQSDQTESGPLLNPEQQIATKSILAKQHQFQVFLLKGITGSGKTEVYFQIMQSVLAEGKQVMVLVPEIGLTPQFLNRVQRRFKQGIAVLHSNLNDSERLHNWLWCHNQQAQILIGTRTAVFADMPELGLIIVDEEHDLSFKQQEGLRFSARDVAIKRAMDKKTPIVLGSATPALESVYNANTDRYHLLTLTTRAVATKPNYYRVVDLRHQKLIEGLCAVTLDRIKSHLHDGNQVMVFINRRGFAPVYLCHQCAWMADCQNCSAHLTLHAKLNQLHCHHCGFICTRPQFCQSCGSPELMAVGVGTERVTSYLEATLADYKVIRVDRDTTRGKNTLKQTLESIDAGQVDVLVGTQMLAKGHHFKKLTLVVILDADSGFFSQDFRALERLGQLLVQVAGRAGRETAGEVIIQTHQPDNPLLTTLIQKGFSEFSQRLLEERESYYWPPYAYLALFRARAKSPKVVKNLFQTIKQQLKVIAPELNLLGPAPAPLEKKAGEFHLQLLLRSNNRGQLHAALKSLKQQISTKPMQKLISQLKFSIDIDPQDLN